MNLQKPPTKWAIKKIVVEELERRGRMVTVLKTRELISEEMKKHMSLFYRELDQLRRKIQEIERRLER